MVRLVWLALAVLLSLLELGLAVQQVRTDKGKIEAKAETRRLAKVTLRLFQNGRPPSGPQFWEAVGLHQPLNDPWGTPYLLDSSAQANAFVWRSAGPDRAYHTADDLVTHLPYGRDGIGIDFTSPSLQDDGPGSVSAQ